MFDRSIDLTASESSWPGANNDSCWEGVPRPALARPAPRLDSRSSSTSQARLTTPRRHPGQAGDVDAIAPVGPAGHDPVQEDNVAALLRYGDAEVADTGQRPRPTA